jgi:hypothetical protein
MGYILWILSFIGSFSLAAHAYIKGNDDLIPWLICCLYSLILVVQEARLEVKDKEDDGLIDSDID